MSYAVLKEYLEFFSFIATIVGLLYIALQIRLQKKKDRVELILKLSNDFYNNDKLQGVFEYLDQDKKCISEINDELERLIVEGTPINVPDSNAIIKEINLNIYFNFFNSIAVLVDEKVASTDLAMKLFRYQLEKTFCFPILLKYMEDYGFEKIKRLLPDAIFTYGTLSDPSQRHNIPELNSCADHLINMDQFLLEDYEIIDVEADKTYKGMIPSKNGQTVLGELVHIEKNASWSNTFNCIDLYEEVDTLYDRKIIKLNNTKKYAWTYLKKK
jgi:gamma-glutamylcyclotransferase (GGCT)/AIG2-like uncharacterized protein YtfP